MDTYEKPALSGFSSCGFNRQAVGFEFRIAAEPYKLKEITLSSG